MAPTAEEIIDMLALAPHPEGGHYRETWREHTEGGVRAAGSAIYYLLRAGERSRWHRVDAAEIWHFYAGAGLTLSLGRDGGGVEEIRLGADLALGERPQAVVAKGAWQSAVSSGDWTLVGCTVSPAFEFAGFEMAPPDFSPGG